MSWPQIGRIVEVQWVDSNMASGWHDDEALRLTVMQGALACRSVGYLYLDAEDRVVVVGDVNDCGQIGEAMTIPRVAITSITTLRSEPQS